GPAARELRTPRPAFPDNPGRRRRSAHRGIAARARPRSGAPRSRRCRQCVWSRDGASWRRSRSDIFLRRDFAGGSARPRRARSSSPGPGCRRISGVDHHRRIGRCCVIISGGGRPQSPCARGRRYRGPGIMSFEIRRADITALTLGSTVLGCGGGGNSYYGQLVARRLLSDDSAVPVIDVDEMDPGSFAITPAVVGAPLVCLEKPPSLIALHAGLKSVKAALHGRVSAFFAAEIGGLQCIFPLLLAAEAGLPLLDGDGMGRAFPELQMTTFAIYGPTHGLPHALSGDRGLLSAGFPKDDDPAMQARSSDEPPGIRFERVVRKICAAEGGLIYLTSAFDRESLRRTLVRGSISLALRIGRAVESAREAHRDPVAAIVEAAEGKRFVAGKVVDVERQFRAGHDWGTVRIEGV